MMKSALPVPLAVALCLLQMLLSPVLLAQEPLWEYINCPAMAGYAQLAMNDSNRVLFVSGNKAAITGYPYERSDLITMNVSYDELAHLRIALDDSARPWMISNRYLYRPIRYYKTWRFTAEPWNVQTTPLFFTVTPEGSMFVTDPFGGALCSNDQGHSWRHVGAAGAGSAQGLLRMEDASLLMWTHSLLYRSTDGGDTWHTVQLPEGTSSIANVTTDGSDILLQGERHATRLLIRKDLEESTWEDLALPMLHGAEIHDVSGYNGEVLLFVKTVHNSMALHMPAGETTWTSIEDLPLSTLHYVFDREGNVVLVSPGQCEFFIAPGRDRLIGYGLNEETAFDAMLCVDDRTFVSYRTLDGFYRSTDGGASWMKTFEYKTRLRHELLFGPSRTTMYCAFDRIMFVSSDGGASWKQNIFEEAYLSRAAETSSGDVFLIARESDSILRSTDIGTSWTEVRSATGRYDSLPLHAVGDRLYLLVNEQLEYSDDFGATWHDVAHFHLVSEPSQFFMLDRDLMFACYDSSGTVADKILFSTDMGSTWDTPKGINFSTLEDLLWLPGCSTLYGNKGSVCQEDIYVSYDRGRTWDAFENPYTRNVYAARLSPQGHLLLTASDNNHMGHFLLRNAAVLSAGDPPAAEQAQLTVWPQPAALGTPLQVEITLDAPGSVQLELFDLLGRRLAVQRREQAAAGTQRFSIPTHDLRPGMYLLRLIRCDDASMATQTLVIQ